MIHSQINILKDSRQLNYHAEYINDAQYVKSVYSYGYEDVDGNNRFDIGDGIFFTRNNEFSVYKDSNLWYPMSDIDTMQDLIPEYINESSINLYFPQHSVETYEDNVKYTIMISTFINGVKVHLSSQIISRNESKPVTKLTKFKNIDYFEYVNVKFPDPWHLCYADEWADFRQLICGEYKEVNNAGSVLLIELTPIVEAEEETWMEMPGYAAGVSSMTMSSDINDHMKLVVSPIVASKSPYVSVDLLFNKAYGGDFKTYLMETYRLNLDFVPGWKIQFDLSWKGEEDIYKMLSYVVDPGVVEISHHFTKDQFECFSWDEFLIGMFMRAAMYIMDEDDNIIFSLLSSEIPLTPEIYKFFINTPVDSVDLELVHMYSYQVDVVNKVQKNIVQVSKPEDYKANILKPIFVTSHPLHNTVFHPEVTESVCIDLNSYKTKVELFYLRLEGVNFVEVGRTAAGVIFKLQGSMLPNETSEGIYYILNENEELVTTGKYTYMQ